MLIPYRVPSHLAANTHLYDGAQIVGPLDPTRDDSFKSILRVPKAGRPFSGQVVYRRREASGRALEL
jgi:hypothetical protein